MATPDITGQRFARLVAIEPTTPRQGRWVVACDCGAQFVTGRNRLLSGHIRSCGCLKLDSLIERRRSHGESHSGKDGNATRLYQSWLAMRGRVNSPNGPMYYRYGGRGIKVCPEWESFETFRDWALANGYRDDLTIDRIDNDGDYCPGNCRWTDSQQQARNRSSNIVGVIDGHKACLAEHADRHGISYDVAIQRIKKLGWSLERAVTTPVRKIKEKA